MAENIKVIIRERRAQVDGGPVIVCGNSDYTITFDFDGDWNLTGPKTARFVYVKDGEVLHEDKVFSGKTVAVPVLSDVSFVDVGVFAGDLCTTTPARIRCKKSILCGSGEVHEPTPDVYAQIMALFNEMAEQGAFGATEAQAQQIEANKQNIAKLTNGTTPAGKATDAAALGGETAEEWQKKLNSAHSEVSKVITQEGWYRVAQLSVNTNIEVASIFDLTFVARLYHVCKIKYVYGVFYPEVSVLTKNSVLTTFQKVREVHTTDKKSYIDVYISPKGEYTQTFAVDDSTSAGYNTTTLHNWVAIDPTLVEEAVEGETVLSECNIPKSISQATNVDVQNVVSEAVSDATKTIKTTTSNSLNQKGWYRIITGTASASTSIIALRNIFNSGGSDAVTFLYQCTIASDKYNNAQIVQLGASSAKDKVYTDVRVVKIDGGVAVDVYYNVDAKNTCYMGLLNLYSQGSWRTCEPVLVETTLEETDIIIQYNIQKNAQPVLNTELAEMLANYLPLNGGGEITGSVQINNAHNLVTSIVNTSDVPAYIAYHGIDGFLGALGFGGKNTPVFYESDYNTPHHLLHDGNSAKVAIQSTAPADGLWVW